MKTEEEVISDSQSPKNIWPHFKIGVRVKCVHDSMRSNVNQVGKITREPFQLKGRNYWYIDVEFDSGRSIDGMYVARYELEEEYPSTKNESQVVEEATDLTKDWSRFKTGTKVIYKYGIKDNIGKIGVIIDEPFVNNSDETVMRVKLESSISHSCFYVSRFELAEEKTAQPSPLQDKSKSINHYNTVCTHCGSPAYIGAMDLKCSNNQCKKAEK